MERTYLTGYLTKVRESELKAFPGENRTALSSPGPERYEKFLRKSSFSDKRKDVCERI